MNKEELECQLTRYQFLKDIFELSIAHGLSFKKEIENELKKTFEKIIVNI